MVSAVAQKQNELAALCRRFGVERLEVFGSATSDTEFVPGLSDVDLIVSFHPDQDLGPWLGNYFAFREAVSELLGCPVDLVMASAMKNPRFVREANRTRTLLYGA